jgi:hypothetical protein
MIVELHLHIQDPRITEEQHPYHVPTENAAVGDVQTYVSRPTCCVNIVLAICPAAALGDAQVKSIRAAARPSVEFQTIPSKPLIVYPVW